MANPNEYVPGRVLAPWRRPDHQPPSIHPSSFDSYDPQTESPLFQIPPEIRGLILHSMIHLENTTQHVIRNRMYGPNPPPRYALEECLVSLDGRSEGDLSYQEYSDRLESAWGEHHECERAYNKNIYARRRRRHSVFISMLLSCKRL